MDLLEEGWAIAGSSWRESKLRNLRMFARKYVAISRTKVQGALTEDLQCVRNKFPGGLKIVKRKEKNKRDSRDR